jgi:hypothetical protein
VIARATNGIANFGAQLNDRLMHLRLDLLFERDFSAFEDFVDMGAQFARLGVDNCELLFNSQSERVVFHAMPRTKNIRRFRRFTQIILTGRAGSPLHAEAAGTGVASSAGESANAWLAVVPRKALREFT